MGICVGGAVWRAVAQHCGCICVCRGVWESCVGELGGEGAVGDCCPAFWGICVEKGELAGAMREAVWGVAVFHSCLAPLIQ